MHTMCVCANTAPPDTVYDVLQEDSNIIIGIEKWIKCETLQVLYYN